MSAHERSKRSWASTCCTQRFAAASVGSERGGHVERVGERVRGIGGQHERAVARRPRSRTPWRPRGWTCRRRPCR